LQKFEQLQYAFVTFFARWGDHYVCTNCVSKLLDEAEEDRSKNIWCPERGCGKRVPCNLLKKRYYAATLDAVGDAYVSGLDCIIDNISQKMNYIAQIFQTHVSPSLQKPIIWLSDLALFVLFFK
jgi:hypothetical protein